MGKNEKTPVTINDKEYNFEDLTEEQQVLFNHVIDLNRKIASAQFNLDQLGVGRQAFLNMLTESINKAEDGIEEGQLVEQPEATVQ